jgi:tetratricopeptide (TPR) repeat protein
MAGTAKPMLVGSAVVLLAVGAGAWWWWGGVPTVSPPPHLEGPAQVDPLVEAAVQRAWSAAEAEPRSAARRLNLAMVFDANAMPDLAIVTYQQALHLDDSQPRAWYHFGICHTETGDLDAALTAFARAADLAPNYGPARWRAGQVHLDRGDLDAAASAFQQAAAVDARDPAGRIGLARIALQRGEPAVAEAHLRAVLQAYPTYSYARLLLGGALRDQGRVDEARVELASGAEAQSIVNDPWRVELLRFRTGHKALVERAQRLIDSGAPAEAILMLEELRARHPADVEVIVSLSAAYIDSGRVDSGVDVLNAAIRRDVQHFAVHLNLSRAHELKQDYRRALEHAEQAIALNPSIGQAHFQRARMLVLSGAEQSEAIEPLEQALRHGGPNLDAALLLGQIRMARGQWEEARSVFEQASRSHPGSAIAWLGLASAQAELASLDEASRSWNRARAVNPDEPALTAVARRINQLRAASPSGGPPPG